MLHDRDALRWGVAQRLAFIEAQLFWEGGLNRAALIATFGISVPQASKDLALYQQHAPANLSYNATRRRYVASERMIPRFLLPDADAYLAGLLDHSASAPTPPPLVAEPLPLPRRPIDPLVLRPVVAAVRALGSIEILYETMVADRAGPAWRRISPHAFAHDGTRWHTRAFCHERRRFLDFILSRCLDARAIGEAAVSPAEDDAWATEFTVILAPNPALTPTQQQVVAHDYGMTEGAVELRVRHAMLAYFHKRLRLDLADYAADPREAGVVVRNKAAYDAVLERASPRPD